MEEPAMRVLTRIRLQLQPCRRNKEKDEVPFLICTFDTETTRCLQVTVRRMLQVEYLVQYITEQHGGHIIPVLDLNNIFVKEKDEEAERLPKISEYLNDLLKNPHCNRDPKLFEFVFQQEVHFPNIQRYDKVLLDAAVLSRRYLNAIFTRKNSGEVLAEDKELLAVYERFTNFCTTYRAVREMILVGGRQQGFLEQIFGCFVQIGGGVRQGVPPIEFVPVKMQRKLIKLEKVIQQGEEAYTRWEVLRETVRELQCNIYKGLHEEHDYYGLKLGQFKRWTRSLTIDLSELIIQAGSVTQEHARYYAKCRKEQVAPFGQQLVPDYREHEQHLELPQYRPSDAIQGLLPRGKKGKGMRKMSQN